MNMRSTVCARRCSSMMVSALPSQRRLQAKLRIGSEHDAYEREADSVASSVMRMPAPGVQRACSGCEDDDRTRVRRKEKSASTPEYAPSAVDSVVGEAGTPLDPSVRSFMEPRFGHSFSDVRVHTDERAAESARAVNALAYTVGKDIVFAKGEYRPESDSGRSLLAHELTHVLQQGPAQTVQRQEDGEPIPEITESADAESYLVGNTMDFVQVENPVAPELASEIGTTAIPTVEPAAIEPPAAELSTTKGPEDPSKKKMGGPMGPVQEGMGKKTTGGASDCKEWVKIARTTYPYDPAKGADPLETEFVEKYKDFKQGVSITKPEDFNTKLKAATANPCTCMEDLKVDGHGGSWSGGAQEFAPRKFTDLGQRSFGVKKGADGTLVPYGFENFDGIKFCKPCKITLGGCYVALNTPKPQAGAGGYKGAGDALGKALALKTGCSVTAYTDLTTTPKAGEFKGSGAGSWITTDPEKK